MELEKKTTLLLDPTSTQFDKDFFLKKDNNMNANISQSSENNDDLSLAAGRIKTESGNGDIDLSKPVPKGNVKKAQPGKKWDWLPCHYELKREEQGTEIYWNLNPIIQLVNPDSKAAPQIDISIDMERPFMYNSEVGWNWHKSWNLPNITVNAKIFEPKTKIPLLPPADLRAQLFAVKVLLNRVEQVKLFDLNLKGSTPQDLSEGSCTFSGVKFSSTSYNNDGVKFHLVLLVCIQDDPRNRLCPKILFSKISPPIFVDSRKAARNSHVFKSKKINSVYFSSFPPDTFTRSFVKRNNKINDSKEEVIENNLEGLSHYFTAPNIRNKVKHPLFLAFKFSNCVKLSYNADLIKEITEQDQINEESLIYAMQKTFLENHQSKREKGDFSNISNKAFDNKYFILVIEEPENTDSFLLNKKIGDYLEPIINDVLHILFNSNLLPPHFSAFPMENIANSYSTIYPRLMSLKESYGESLDEDNEDFEENSDDEHYKTEFNSKRKRSENAFDFDDSDEEGPRAPTASASKKKVKADKKKPKVANKPSSEEKVANEGSAKKSKSGAPAANKKVKKSELMAQKEAQKAKPSTKVETPQFDPPSASMKMESENIMAKDEENSFDETGSRMGASSMVDQTKLEISESFMSLKREMITKTEPKDNTQSFGGFPSNINPYMGMQQQQYHQHQQQQSQQRFTQQNANGSQNHLMSMMYEQFMKNPKTVPEPNAHLQNQQQQQQQQQPQNQHQQVDPRQQFLEVQIMKRQQQLLQLQSKLKEMQEKVTVNKTSNTSSHDKLNQPNEMPPSQPDLRNLPPNMPNQSFANQAYFNNMQYPKMMLDRSGNNMMENKQIGHSIPENYMRGPYPGLQMAGQAKNQMGQMGVPAAFFNFQQDGTLGNMAKGKGPISGPKQTK